MLLVICHLSCDVIGYEGSKGDWCSLIHLLSQMDDHWLLVKLSLVQSFYCCQLSTTVLFRTRHTQAIIFHLLMKWLLGSNLSRLYILLLFSQSKPRSKPRLLNRFRAIISTCFLRVKINDSMECFLITYFSLDKLFHFILELKILFPLKMY